MLLDYACGVNSHFSYEFMNCGSCSKCDTVHMTYHSIVLIVYSYTNSAAKTKIKYDAEFFVLKSKGDSLIILSLRTSQKLKS